MIVLTGLLAGCQGPVNTPGPSTGAMVSFADDVVPIFRARCVSCHASGSLTNSLTGLDMRLTEDLAYDTTVGVPSDQDSSWTLVEPGDPDASLLWLKVSSNNPPVGSIMPLFGARVSGEDLATLRDWIMQGALDN